MSLRQILSVPCPVSGAKPRERCTLSTGQPWVKTHLARKLAASESGTEILGHAALRTLIAATSGALRILFQRSQRRNRRDQTGARMFFQIHKDGQAVDGGSYSSLEEAASALESGNQGVKWPSRRIGQDRPSLHSARVPCQAQTSPCAERLGSLRPSLAFSAHGWCLCRERLAPAATRPKSRLALQSHSASGPATLLLF